MKGKRKATKKPYTRGNSNKDMRRDQEVEGTSRKELKADSRDYRDCRSTPNDPAWYAHSPQIITDFASLPFGNPLGSTLPRDVAGLGNGAVPGIMTLWFNPTIGYATSENAAVNVAMRNIYSFVRHANSGHSNYDAPDLMIYLLAMDSLYMYHAWIKRLYGQLLLDTTYNRYYPQALVESEYVDYLDLQRHIADFRGFINLFAVKIQAMALPNSMSYMARHSWMCEGLYVDDGSTPKAQTYKYVPAAFYQFTLNEEGAGSLQYTGNVVETDGSMPSTLRTFNDIVALGNSLINPILANEDMNIMSGDILKAFGDSGIVHASGITEDFRVLPVYSQEVLSQMENATIFNGWAGGAVSQATAVGTGYLTSTPFAHVNSVNILGFTPSSPITLTPDTIANIAKVYGGTRLLNMHHQNVSPDEVMVATRLQVVTGSAITSDSNKLDGSGIHATVSIESCGSEVICKSQMWTFNPSGTVKQYAVPLPTLYAITVESDRNLGTVLSNFRILFRDMAMAATFDWNPLYYPLIVTYSGTSVDAVYQPNCVIGDISNYTTLSLDNLVNMNNIALLSEFSVPMAGLFA